MTKIEKSKNSSTIQKNPQQIYNIRLGSWLRRKQGGKCVTRLVEYHTGRTQLENQTDCEVFYHQAEEQEVSVDICVVPLTDYKEFHQDK